VGRGPPEDGKESRPQVPLQFTIVKQAWAVVVVVVVGAILMVSGALMIVRDSTGPGPLVIAVVFVALICTFAARVDLAAMVRALDALRLLVPIVAFFLVGTFIGSRKGTLAFDEVGAQLIIVLLLALALEARFFRIGVDRFDAMVSLLVIALLAAGELYALQGVLDRAPEHAEMIGGAIAAGFAAVAVSAVLGPTRRSVSEEDDPGGPTSSEKTPPSTT
jgi:hypothetical protein